MHQALSNLYILPIRWGMSFFYKQIFWQTHTNIYADFTYPRSIGKQCVTKVAYATGEPVEEVHLVATLEQLTFVERQLAALGL